MSRQPEDKRAIAALESWYQGLPKPNAGLPAKGSLAVGLVLLDRLQSDYTLTLASHLAAGGAQIQGASGAAVRRILKKFGESRPFTGEGGRTNRGIPAIADSLLGCLRELSLESHSEPERKRILEALQARLVEYVREFHNRARLKPIYDPAQSCRAFVTNILTLADDVGKRGPVAQYLIGAKLQLRFPGETIRNQISSAADDQTGQPGDFFVGDTAFHVTVAPTPGHYEKCRRNLQDGRRVYLLVPEELLVGARQNAELTAPDRIAVESIQSFVAQNVEELSVFGKKSLVVGLRQLIEVYNDRVGQVESDKSLLIELPPNL